MTAMSIAAVLALIATRNCVPSSLAQVMTGIALHESRLDPTLIHYNHNGTFDVGLAQVNSANFRWLGLTLQDALDPCKNLAAGAKVLLSRYNGSTGALGAAYAAGAEAAIRQIGALSPLAAQAPAERTPTRPLAGPSRTGRDLSFSVHMEK